MLESFRIDWDGIQRQEEGKEKIKMEEYPDDPSDLLFMDEFECCGREKILCLYFVREFLQKKLDHIFFLDRQYVHDQHPPGPTHVDDSLPVMATETFLIHWTDCCYGCACWYCWY